jgi:hypothetical protein
MKPIGEMTEEELAAYVEEHLRQRGIRAVLSGGSCVTIYARGDYVSGDLDLVLETYVRPKAVADALAELGLQRAGRVYKHPEAALVIDVLMPPPAVGGEPVGEIVEMAVSTGILRLLSPTDCTKDRLAAYYYHGDRQCLEQARLVVARQDVDLAEVEAWSVREGQAEAFAAIREFLLAAEHARKGRHC